MIERQLYYTTKSSRIPSSGTSSVKFTRCFLKYKQIRIVVVFVMNVSEMIRFSLYFLLEFAFTASKYEKLKLKVQDKSLNYTVKDARTQSSITVYVQLTS